MVRLLQNTVAGFLFPANRTPPAVSDAARGRFVPMAVRVLRYWIIAGLMATAMTLFTAFQTRLQFMLRGQEMAYFDTVLWSGVIWYIWALLAPLAIILTMRHPIEKGPGLVRAVALQVLFAAGFIGLHATLAAAVMHLYPERFGILPEFGPAILQLLAMQGHWGFMSYIALVAMVHVGIYFRRAQTEALAREELRTQAASAQLTALARQMQPHFLFNALNALVAMLEEGSTPQVFTIRLAQMLRILLQSGDRATATLGEELALVEAYLEIERARLGSRLRTEIQVSPAVTECRLPAFILQPLVENAITHGIARTLEGGQIQVRAQRDAADVVIDISNTCSSPSTSQEPADGMQLTIPNCRRRLALMYGPQARFEAGFVTRNLFRASIILPLDSSALAPPT